MTQSESIGNLALAMSKAQGELHDVYKDKKGYGYNYADLSSVLEITRPVCSKYELAVVQPCTSDSASVTVTTRVMHSSGEWISSSLTLPLTVGKGMTHAQAIGSCITYGRRYGLAAMMGVSQTDDDASSATTIDAERIETISASLVEALKKKILESGADIEAVCKSVNVSRLCDMTASQYNRVSQQLDIKISRQVKSNIMRELVANKSTPEIDESTHDDFHAELGEVNMETGEIV
jgi:hypothetical protein